MIFVVLPSRSALAEGELRHKTTEQATQAVLEVSSLPSVLYRSHQPKHTFLGIYIRDVVRAMEFGWALLRAYGGIAADGSARACRCCHMRGRSSRSRHSGVKDVAHGLPKRARSSVLRTTLVEYPKKRNLLDVLL